MHIARQRALLTALGIQQWIPRALQTCRTSQDSGHMLWRHTADNDHTPAESIGSSTHSVARPIEQQHIQHIDKTPDLPAMVTPASATHFGHEQPVQDIDKALAQPQSTGLNFRLQACEINQWIVLIDEADLQHPQHRQLWQNIIKAFNQPATTHFSWPLSEGQRWQLEIGVQAALSGFLFRLGLDKRVGLMSALPDEICPDRIERLPYLHELMLEPLKKRTLWHLLQQK